jgi:hypothetical protein
MAESLIDFLKPGLGAWTGFLLSEVEVLCTNGIILISNHPGFIE